MKVSKNHILSFIPQRAPFVMIDNLLEATPERFVTDFTILPENIFIEDGILREFALIENISQSSAVGLALMKNNNVQNPAHGFIGSISRLKIFDLPNVNDTISTTITPIAQLGGMFLLRAETFVGEKKLLECEVKLVGSNSN